MFYDGVLFKSLHSDNYYVKTSICLKFHGPTLFLEVSGICLGKESQYEVGSTLFDLRSLDASWHGEKNNLLLQTALKDFPRFSENSWSKMFLG